MWDFLGNLRNVGSDIISGLKGFVDPLVTKFLPQRGDELVSPVPESVREAARQVPTPRPTSTPTPTPTTRTTTEDFISAPRGTTDAAPAGPGGGPGFRPGEVVPGGQTAPHESRGAGALWDSGGITYEWTGSDWVPRDRTGAQNPEQMADSIVSTMTGFVDQIFNSEKLSEFERENPFAFDEIAARASAEARLGVPFDEEISDLMESVRRTRERSIADTQRLIGELSTDSTRLIGRERRATDEAIEASEKGYAGQGLFFSGARQKATGRQEVGGIERVGDIEEATRRGITGAERGKERTLQDVLSRERIGKRQIGAARTTAYETDIYEQEREAGLQRGLEYMEFLGMPRKPMDWLSGQTQFLQGLV